MTCYHPPEQCPKYLTICIAVSRIILETVPTGTFALMFARDICLYSHKRLQLERITYALGCALVCISRLQEGR